MHIGMESVRDKEPGCEMLAHQQKPLLQKATFLQESLVRTVAGDCHLVVICGTASGTLALIPWEAG